jgi:hypothetical protein
MSRSLFNCQGATPCGATVIISVRQTHGKAYTTLGSGYSRGHTQSMTWQAERGKAHVCSGRRCRAWTKSVPARRRASIEREAQRDVRATRASEWRTSALSASGEYVWRVPGAPAWRPG